MVLLEAAALSRCIIASRIGGIPEIVEDEKTGLLFTPGNERELKEKINFIIKNPNEAERMGWEARKKVEEEFGPNTHYKKLINIYESLINL
jgi:glycosyltransferase involved in cell wall biosynthesis